MYLEFIHKSLDDSLVVKVKRHDMRAMEKALSSCFKGYKVKTVVGKIDDVKYGGVDVLTDVAAAKCLRGQGIIPEQPIKIYLEMDPKNTNSECRIVIRDLAFNHPRILELYRDVLEPIGLNFFELPSTIGYKLMSRIIRDVHRKLESRKVRVYDVEIMTIVLNRVFRNGHNLYGSLRKTNTVRDKPLTEDELRTVDDLLADIKRDLGDDVHVSLPDTTWDRNGACLWAALSCGGKIVVHPHCTEERSVIANMAKSMAGHFVGHVKHLVMKLGMRLKFG